MLTEFIYDNSLKIVLYLLKICLTMRDHFAL